MPATLPLSQTNSDATRIHISEIISALSYALDLTEGQPMGHTVRACILGMKIAERIGMSEHDKSQLYYALLLKDTGCSSNSARVYQIFGSDDRSTKRNLKTVDWTKLLEGFRYVRDNTSIGKSLFERSLRIVQVAAKGPKDANELVQIRCERGADIARTLGFSEATAEGIYYLDEQWNGRGHPRGLFEDEIPLFARILGLSQAMEVFATAESPARAFEIVRERSGRWFDPELARAALDLEHDQSIWDNWSTDKARQMAIDLEPPADVIWADSEHTTRVCEGFAGVVDAKSPWTHHHSLGVAEVSVGIAQELGLDETQITLINQAALLHDIGKLGISNAILDKPAKLTDEEFAAVRKHPYFTQRIVEKVAGFEELAFIASAHHEKLDGSGYFRNLSGADLTMPARILAVADIYDALSAQRPYRDSMPTEKVFSIMSKDVPHALCAECFEALQRYVAKNPPQPQAPIEW